MSRLTQRSVQIRQTHPLTVRRSRWGTGLAGCTTEQSGEEDVDADDAGAEEPAPYVYRIGMVNFLTGSLADFGSYNERGVALALEDVNASGIGGFTLEIIVENSGSLPDAGVSAAQELVNQDQVPLIIGAFGSSVSPSVYESVIQGDRCGPAVAELHLCISDGVPRSGADVTAGGPQVQVLADLIADDGVGSVAVAWVNNGFGQSQRDGFVNTFGGEVE